MRRLGHLYAVALLFALPAFWGQNAPATHHAKKPPKPEPTQQELFDYVRGQLLTLSPGDSVNDNLEVSYNMTTSILSITRPDGRCDILLGNLDSNSTLWEVFDPSDSYRTREQVLRLTMTSLNGKKARTCYDKNNKVDANIPDNRARLLFSLQKTNAIAGFTDRMGTALTKLITLAGGTPEKDIF